MMLEKYDVLIILWSNTPSHRTVDSDILTWLDGLLAKE